MKLTRAEAIRNAHAWFEVNSGWAPPDGDTLGEWIADDVCRCPDDCLVAPDGVCEHGLASWWLILKALEDGLSNQPERALREPMHQELRHDERARRSSFMVLPLERDASGGRVVVRT